MINLVRDLQRQFGLTMLFISHNLAVVKYVSDIVAVMYLGQIVEVGPAAQILTDPQHPYTRELLDAASGTDLMTAGDIGVADAEPADVHHPPTGCRYHPRCAIGPLVMADRDLCRTDDPTVDASHRAHQAACHFTIDIVGKDRT